MMRAFDPMIPNQKPPGRRSGRSLAGLSALLFASAGVGCGVPEYRLNIDTLPAAAVELAVIAYVFPEQGPAVSVSLSPIGLKDERQDVSVGLDLQGQVSDQPAEFSVAAKDASGCIVATGATERVQRRTGDVVRDVPLHMQPKSDLAAPGACMTTRPVILSAERVQRGLWHAQDFQLILHGWNWSQQYSPQVRSTGAIFCDSLPPPQPEQPTYPLCAALDCQGSCTTEPLSGRLCKTNCLMKTSSVQRGGSRIDASVSAPAGLSKDASNSVLSQPLVIRLEPAADAFGTYDERPPR